MSVRDSAIALLSQWRPPDHSQDSLRNAVLAFLDARDDACLRACAPGHITASTLVLDHSGHNVLLTLHPRLGRWVQLGGPHRSSACLMTSSSAVDTLCCLMQGRHAPESEDWRC